MTIPPKPEGHTHDGKKVLVLGAGRSGQAAARWLRSQGAHVTVSDLLPLDDWPTTFLSLCQEKGIGIEAGANRVETAIRSDLVIVSPGIPLTIPAISEARLRGIPVHGELDLAISHWMGPILALTGTNGKTTTTALTGAMLEAAGIDHRVAGNIGTPLSRFLEGHTEKTVAVLEVSSFQLDAIPDGASIPPMRGVAWLNLAPDHLDRYPDLDSYGQSKAKILDLVGTDGCPILNRDDPHLAPWIPKVTGRLLTFGHGAGPDAGAAIRQEQITVRWPDGQTEEYPLGGWSLPGRHNRENLAAAILLARLAGARPRDIQQTIGTFHAPAHRLEFVLTRDGISYYNDSKATNVASVLRAMDAIDRPIVLIAGGRGKGEDYAPLLERGQGRLRAVVVLGEEAESIRRVFDGHVPISRVQGETSGRAVMHAAVRIAEGHARTGDVILLAPACASFDLFSNFEERGRIFMETVRAGKGIGT